MRYYHNPRCAKSREGLQLLTEKGIVPEIVEYMKEPMTPAELNELIDKLGISADELVRKKEKIWKEEYADKELTGEELVLAMIENPRLMERPILVNGNKAAIGRPPENLLEIV
jgi:arsenate reductase